MKITLRKSGKFYWKKQVVPHRQAVHTHSYTETLVFKVSRAVRSGEIWGGSDIYKVVTKWHILYVQIFLFWWVIGIDMELEDGDFSNPTYMMNFHKQLDADKVH